MAKAMLIMDMPESCGKCEYHDIRLDGTIRCIACREHMRDGVPKSCRADWCPLREVPKRVDFVDKYPDDSDLYLEDFSIGYSKGYNACIDEILGS